MLKDKKKQSMREECFVDMDGWWTHDIRVPIRVPQLRVREECFVGVIANFQPKKHRMALDIHEAW